MRVIRRGDRGAPVVEIRAILAEQGSLIDHGGPALAGRVRLVDQDAAAETPIDADSVIELPPAAHSRPDPLDVVFDESVERAVRAFQQSRGLTANGEVNEETWRALDAARWQLGARVLSYSTPEQM